MVTCAGLEHAGSLHPRAGLREVLAKRLKFIHRSQATVSQIRSIGVAVWAVAFPSSNKGGFRSHKHGPA